MNALANFPPFTTAEFHKMALRGAFGDLRVELRRGMIVKMSPKHVPHVMVQEDLTFALKLAVKAAKLPWRVGTEGSVSFGEGFDPMPDIVVFDPSIPPTSTGTIDPRSVKLIVEISDSSLDDDMGEKREDYARFGLAEYWVADVNARIVHVHARPVDRAFATATDVKLGEAIVMLTNPAVVARMD